MDPDLALPEGSWEEGQVRAPGLARDRPPAIKWGEAGYRRLALAAALTLGLVLRLYRIGAHGLWIDEAFSVWLARQPLNEMLRWVREVDHHPPLYYSMLSGWISVCGSGESAVRALSALFGTLNIGVIYLLGRRLCGAWVGAVAAWVLALSPLHVRYAQEARMYTLLTLFASLALYAFLHLWRKSGGLDQGGGDGSPALGPATGLVPGWLGYVIFTTCMLWTHNTAVFFPVAANLIVFARAVVRRRSKHGLTREPGGALRSGGRPNSRWLRRWAAAQGAVLILWSPWIPALVVQAVDVYRRFWLPAPELTTVASIAGVLLWDFPAERLLTPLLVSTVLAGTTLYGLWHLSTSARGRAWIGAFFLVPLVGQWAASAWRPILAEHTMIWTSVPLYLMLAVGIRALTDRVESRRASRLLQAAPIIALIAVQGAAVGAYYAAPVKEDWVGAAALVAEHLAPEDTILFSSSWGQIPFDYYLAQQYNRGAGPEVAEHGLPVDLFDRGVLEPEMTRQDLDRLQELIAGRRRVWLISSHAWYADPEGLVPSALRRRMDLERRWALPGVEVRLYTGG